MNWENRIYESLVETRERTRAGNKIRGRKAREKARAEAPKTRWVGSSETGNMQKFVDGNWVDIPRLNIKDKKP